MYTIHARANRTCSSAQSRMCASTFSDSGQHVHSAKHKFVKVRCTLWGYCIASVFFTERYSMVFELSVLACRATVRALVAAKPKQFCLRVFTSFGAHSSWTLCASFVLMENEFLCVFTDVGDAYDLICMKFENDPKGIPRENVDDRFFVLLVLQVVVMIHGHSSLCTRSQNFRLLPSQEEAGTTRQSVENSALSF